MAKQVRLKLSSAKQGQSKVSLDFFIVGSVKARRGRANLDMVRFLKRGYAR
jgi:hypothetical protein